MTDMSSSRTATLTLAFSTLLATIFVAVQAWYARVAVVEAAQTRFLEDKLNICFEAFDAAAELDAALRKAVPSMQDTETWPPRIIVTESQTLTKLQYDVVPRLNQLQSGLIKGSILGDLDKYRAYLVQQLDGLSKQLLDLSPARLGEGQMDSETEAVMNRLSEFLGAQYPVLTGCRLVAEGKA